MKTYLDVDGFVSMINWTEKSIRKYSSTHLVMPTAMTVGEALNQTSWGAHMQKLAGGDIGFVRRARGDAAFDYCPIMVTGGQTPEKMPETFQAGAIMVGSGFDLMLKGKPAGIGVKEIVAGLKPYLESARQARSSAWPALAEADGRADKEAWLDALPHFHPF